MHKRVWLTMLDKDEQRAKELYQTTTQYGLEADGHFWVNDMQRMAWAGAADSLAEPTTGLWLIAGRPESLNSPETRCGLSLLALTVQGRRGALPSVLVLPLGDSPDTALPTAFADAEILDPHGTIGPKLPARANRPAQPLFSEYRLAVHPLPGIGVWFEVGPAPGATWNGALFGVDQGEITAHGVGPAGQVPQRTVLQYQMRGLTLESASTQYTAWAVHNPLTETESYYLHSTGTPQRIVFGPFADTDAQDMFHCQLG